MALSKGQVQGVQRTLNGFFKAAKLGYKPLATDGAAGPRTRKFIRLAKYYLGWGDNPSSKVDHAFLEYVRHPDSKHQPGRGMAARGKARRVKRRAQLKAQKAKGSASDRLWGGSRQFTNRAIRVSNRYKIPVTSRKRGTALNGNKGSDHNLWNTSADAVDLGTFNGKSLAHAIAREFGIKGYRTGNYQRYYVRGKNGKLYSVQILWAVSGHYNHVHVGVRRA